MRWPFVSRAKFDRVQDRNFDLQTENYTLRDALKNANAELLKHRTLIVGLKTCQSEVIELFEKVIGEKP